MDLLQSKCLNDLHRNVVRGGKKGLKLPFKYKPKAVFSLLLSNEKLHFETNSELIIP